jgi:hypothetical protein
MGTLLRVLIVSDSTDDVESYGRELARGGYDPSVERVATGAAMASSRPRRQILGQSSGRLPIAVQPAREPQPPPG